jgi:hypothetical protein
MSAGEQLEVRVRAAGDGWHAVEVRELEADAWREADRFRREADAESFARWIGRGAYTGGTR